MFSSDKWFGAEASFYNGVATQSLRLNDDDSAFLTRTPSSASNRRTWTWSAWLKRGNIDTSGVPFSSYSGSIDYFNIQITSSNTLQVMDRVSGNYPYIFNSNQVFRDVASWYHIVVATDTTQSTESNRVKIYVNGEQITSWSSSTYPSQNYDTYINTTNNHLIGQRGTSGHYFDGYLAEINFVDGYQYDPTYFGETKSGVWIAKKYTGAYGTNGFRLQFKETGTGTASSSTIGADTSGNNNHFTSSGIVASDCNMPDSPENNFCTLNPIGRRYGQSYVATYSEGNLKFVSGGNATNVFGTMAINQIASEGGVYFELRFDSIDSVRTYFGVIGDNGVNNKNVTSNSGGYTFPIKGMLSSTPRGYFTTDTDASNSVDLTANSAFSNGDVAGIAILSDGKFFVHRNGTYLNNASGNTGNPSTGANPIGTIDLTEGDWLPYLGYSSSYSANFGQDGTFAGQETSGGNSDANGIGDFMFAVPTNCLALCTSNMAEPTISPNSSTQADDHFNTVLYTGNATDDTAIAVDFQPDWTWIKKRSGAQEHVLFDSSRGATKRLFSNLTNAESDEATSLKAFTSSGFTLGTHSSVNDNTETFVAWNWKANGGTTSSNSDGTITSTVQANTTAGFSIILYTGNATGGATVGHGLGKAPKWVITKARSGSYSWLVGHDEIASDAWTDALLLDTADAASDSNLFWNDTAPNSTVVTLGGAYNPVNGNGVTYVMYAFAEIEGYSKFGSYTSNNSSTDNAFVYTGFRPAFVMVKMTPSATEWVLMDNKRSSSSGGNPIDSGSYPNYNYAEYTNANHTDFLSNGFKIRATSGVGYLTRNVVYMAFAEAPFKYANAR